LSLFKFTGMIWSLDGQKISLEPLDSHQSELLSDDNKRFWMKMYEACHMFWDSRKDSISVEKYCENILDITEKCLSNDYLIVLPIFSRLVRENEGLDLKNDIIKAIEDIIEKYNEINNDFKEEEILFEFLFNGKDSEFRQKYLKNGGSSRCCETFLAFPLTSRIDGWRGELIRYRDLGFANDFDKLMINAVIEDRPLYKDFFREILFRLRLNPLPLYRSTVKGFFSKFPKVNEIANSNDLNLLLYYLFQEDFSGFSRSLYRITKDSCFSFHLIDVLYAKQYVDFSIWSFALRHYLSDLVKCNDLVEQISFYLSFTDQKDSKVYSTSSIFISAIDDRDLEFSLENDLVSTIRAYKEQMRYGDIVKIINQKLPQIKSCDTKGLVLNEVADILFDLEPFSSQVWVIFLDVANNINSPVLANILSCAIKQFENDGEIPRI